MKLPLMSDLSFKLPSKNGISDSAANMEQTPRIHRWIIIFPMIFPTSFGKTIEHLPFKDD
jgi:hypothetical protein